MTGQGRFTAFDHDAARRETRQTFLFEQIPVCCRGSVYRIYERVASDSKAVGSLRAAAGLQKLEVQIAKTLRMVGRCTYKIEACR